MTGEKLYKIMNDIDDKYIEEARKSMDTYMGAGKINQINKKKKLRYKSFVAIAACLCLVAVGATLLNNRTVGNAPHPEQLQVANPLIELASAEEMAEYLGFDVPVLDKEVEAYIVIVNEDSYPTIGRIEYADGNTFNMEYGTGDISGIYGGELSEEKTINDTNVSFYTYSDGISSIKYALWEKDGFTYSLTGADNLKDEVQSLIAYN